MIWALNDLTRVLQLERFKGLSLTIFCSMKSNYTEKQR